MWTDGSSLDSVEGAKQEVDKDNNILKVRLELDLMLFVLSDKVINVL